MQIDQLSKKVLAIYQTAQCAQINDLSESAFALIRKEIHFDSAGICDFAKTQQSSFQLTSALAYQISTKDKLQARNNFIKAEKISADGKLQSEDPLLSAAYNDGFHSKFANSKEFKTNTALTAYAKETEAFNTLTMVIPDFVNSRVQSISLWRGNENFSFNKKDALIADMLLPHIHQSIALNRKIHHLQQAGANDALQAISSIQGVLHFIDEDAIPLLRKQFRDWVPPFLPDTIMKALLSTSERVYVNQYFTLSARRCGDLLYLTCKPGMTFDQLSPTELIVASCIARGDSYKVIAQKLGTQPATVRNQVHSVYVKLGVSGKAALARRMAMSE